MMRPTSMIWPLSSLLALLLVGQAQAHGDHDNMQRARDAERQHYFPEAEQYLRAVIEDDPGDAQAWLTLASLETVRGDLDQARQACARVLQHFDAITGLACRGRIALAGGIDRREALQSLHSALEHPAVADRSDVYALWASGVAAELAASLGEAAIAESFFQRALAGSPAIHLQAAYLDFLLDADRPAEVLTRVGAGEEELALKLRRVMALLALDRSSEAERLKRQLHATFGDWIAAGDFTHGREMAMFYLSVMPRPEIARRAATRNLEVQREREDWQLYRAVNTVAEDS